MKKALYKGSCQCCGSVQKLPSGQLAKHGYRVLWSEFVGTCRGAGHLPYEQSCGLLEKFIAEARQAKRKRREEIEVLQQTTAEGKGWLNVYMGGSRTHGPKYEWYIFDLITDDRGGVGFINNRGHFESAIRNGLHGRDITSVASQMNERRAQAWEKSIQDLARYIAWQQQRIRDWRPRNLYPIADRIASEPFV